MNIPSYVTELMDCLERRGYEAWLVGGCVRDHALGIEPHDFDLCTSALPQQTQAVFAGYELVLAGLKHGTVGVVTEHGVVEITTFRAEGDYADSRHPGWVEFVPDLKQDLMRRDFTINAMAWSPKRGWQDPFGGLEALKNKRLRCVGDPELRFREDALRILRGARFAARFGLEIEERTWQAMLSTAPLMDALARERVFEEIAKLICHTDAAMLCKLAPILAQAIPELKPMIGFDQHSRHHAYDVFTHTAWVVHRVSPEPVIRMAALLHDVGKPSTFSIDDLGRGHFIGHAKVGEAMADEILLRLKAPTEFRETVTWLIGAHMSFFQPTRKGVRSVLSRYGLEKLLMLGELHRADLLGKDAEDISARLSELNQVEELIRQVQEEEGRMTLKKLAVKGGDLMTLGIPAGPYMGEILERLLRDVIFETIPNERSPLLERAGYYWREILECCE